MPIWSTRIILRRSDSRERQDLAGGGTFDDLIIGVPYDHIGSDPDGDGAVIVVYGGGTGLDSQRSEAWYAAKLGHPNAYGGSFGIPVVS